MIVCLCRGVSEREIRRLMAAGTRTAQAVTAACGAGGDCGACILAVAELVEQDASELVTGVSP
jgi:bacterioferritin-associated ferredoxin